MGALMLIGAVMMSAAVLLESSKGFGEFDSDRVPPPLPENVAVYKTIGSDERPQGSDEDPDSCTTIPHRMIALAH
jgi:hypothetical protein